MDMVKRNWWMVAAAMMAGLQIVAAFDREPNEGYLDYSRSTLVLVAGLVVIAGVVVRRRSSRRVGSAMIGLGVLPSVLPIVLFWFPPALLYGALAIAVSVTAFSDAAAARKLATI